MAKSSLAARVFQLAVSSGIKRASVDRNQKWVDNGLDLIKQYKKQDQRMAELGLQDFRDRCAKAIKNRY